jgi:1-acyl-sn-glycerol-3-phosphate acyltransferase
MPLIIIVAGAVVLATAVIIMSGATSGKVAQRLTVKWARIVLKSLGISCSIENAANIVTGTSYIITPNHQSIIDFLPLLSLLPSCFRWS